MKYCGFREVVRDEISCSRLKCFPGWRIAPPFYRSCNVGKLQTELESLPLSLWDRNNILAGKRGIFWNKGTFAKEFLLYCWREIHLFQGRWNNSTRRVIALLQHGVFTFKAVAIHECIYRMFKQFGLSGGRDTIDNCQFSIFLGSSARVTRVLHINSRFHKRESVCKRSNFDYQTFIARLQSILSVCRHTKYLSISQSQKIVKFFEKCY